jgi:hypothetical protein
VQQSKCLPKSSSYQVRRRRRTVTHLVVAEA